MRTAVTLLVIADLFAGEAIMGLRGTRALPGHATLFWFVTGADLGRVQKAAAVNWAMLRRAWARPALFRRL